MEQEGTSTPLLGEEEKDTRTHHTFSQTPRSYQLEMLEYALKQNVRRTLYRFDGCELRDDVPQLAQRTLRET